MRIKTLTAEQKNLLRDAVWKGRDAATAGAFEALQPLCVTLSHAPGRLSDDEKAFRNQLRAHARQLGDERSSSGEQAVSRLQAEIAYEQWHRVLFTRYLVENGLLIHPDTQGPIDLALCEELAADEGKETWELASEYASRMLPEIFRVDDPTQRIRLPRNRLQELERHVLGLPREVFLAADSLGWSYQYWQAPLKRTINEAGVKIGADELPAVTQLFTEDYMLEFLLQNSLGAWWTSTHPDKPSPVPLPYLKVDAQGVPVAGRYAGWPADLSEFRVLDPCCGSGHIPVFLLSMLVPMRMELEGLSATEAVDRVLTQNIFALELDPRCVEIAVFALALAAWTYPGAEGYRPLPPLNIACCGLPIMQKISEWERLAGTDLQLQAGMRALYGVFKDAPTLGSLLQPRNAAGRGLFAAGFDTLFPLMETALAAAGSDESKEGLLTAQGLLQATRLLAQDYDLVITNTPYLGNGDFGPVLKAYVEQEFPDAKQDLANAMLERCLGLVKEGGVVQFVMPQNWLYQVSYQEHRTTLLRTVTWNLLARLDEKAFSSSQAAGAFVILITLTRKVPDSTHEVAGLDVADARTPEAKAQALLERQPICVAQAGQLKNPEARVTLRDAPSGELLGKYAKSFQGLKTGDDARHRAFFWEVDMSRPLWRPLQSTVLTTREWGGMNSVVRWQQEGALIARRQGLAAWGKQGVAISQMRKLPAALFAGDIFDSNVAPIVPLNSAHLPAVWCFCSSTEFVDAVRAIDKKTGVANASVVQIPFDFQRWDRLAKERYPQGLPLPASNDPTQWVFHGHPAKAEHPLQVAVARLAGYRWPVEVRKGLKVAPETLSLAQQAHELHTLADPDGIVPLVPVRGKPAAADRLVELLSRAYGKQWSPAVLDSLLAQESAAGTTLEQWLRDRFFEGHCTLFEGRPFIWHVWDGQPDGFAALLNYHKLTKATLKTLAYSYLGTWLSELEKRLATGDVQARALLAAGKELQQKLVRILDGEAPCDIFVRWKTMAEQPLGWDPDLDDGVRVNIRPFVSVDDIARKGAGVLRCRPDNLHWRKDNGAELSNWPWYHLGPQYGLPEGTRINEHHTTLAQKKAARP